MRRRSVLLVGAILLIAAACGTAPPSDAASYLNSSEPQCGGTDSTVLMCDDFEDGSYVFNVNGPSDPVNDGWRADIFSPAGTFPDPQGTGFGRCGALGAAGTNCAATTGPRALTVGQGPAQAEHGFGPVTLTGRDEVYVRLYYRPASSQEYATNYKQMTINTYDWGSIKFINLAAPGWGAFATGTSQMSGGLAYENSLYNDPRRHQNRNCLAGGTATRNPANYYPGAGDPICVNPFRIQAFTPPHWYYIEVHIRLNTPGIADGVFEMWIDDCGANGLGCTGTGTLRSQYSDIQWKAVGDTALISSLWLENWSNPGSAGEEYYDQIVVATRRVGPMGAAPPPPPTNQFARPDSDVLFQWNTAHAPAWNKLNELTPNDDRDTSTIRTHFASGPETVEIGLSDVPLGSGYTLRVRAMREGTGTLTYEVRQGTTVIASATHSLPMTVFTTDALALTPAQVAAITDPTDLRVRLIGAGGNDLVFVSWVEMEVVPAAGSPPTGGATGLQVTFQP